MYQSFLCFSTFLTLHWFGSLCFSSSLLKRFCIAWHYCFLLPHIDLSLSIAIYLLNESLLVICCISKYCLTHQFINKAGWNTSMINILWDINKMQCKFG